MNYTDRGGFPDGTPMPLLSSFCVRTFETGVLGLF